jgi:hypothetical protein
LRHAAAIHYTTEAEREEAIGLYAALAEVRSFVVPIPVRHVADVTGDNKTTGQQDGGRGS